jgi:hypothetical protein
MDLADVVDHREQLPLYIHFQPGPQRGLAFISTTQPSTGLPGCPHSKNNQQKNQLGAFCIRTAFDS